jgi:molecular chaperone DnaK (HSP70)
VPAYFSDAQRQATREAGEIAGLNVVRMINEPTAAALLYGSNSSGSKHMLVYDLGGGTFDVSVVNTEAGVVEVLSSHGDNHLGGDDFDQQIIEYLLDHLQATYNVDARSHSKAMARITRAAENAKFILSDQPYVQIEEEYLLEHEGSAIHLSVELSRMEYEEMIGDYINATLDAVHIALKGAKFIASDIDKIVLVGGSTRTPCIRERLFNEFGFEPHGEVDPDLCVAMGAAIQAAMISGQEVDTVLVDVTPYTYGTGAIGMLKGEVYPFMFVPIIHKNSALPNRKTEAFVTNFDGQKAVEVTIYQGEDPDALNNIKVGEFWVEGLQDVEAGNVITLTLGLDLNGMLHVSAQEKATGLEKSITFKNA